MKLNRTPHGDYIQGEFLKIEDPNGEIDSRDPGNLEDPTVKFPFSFEHVHEAVSAAKRSFQSWKRLAVTARQSHLTKYRELIKERTELLASAITLEIGKPLWESREEIKETLDLIDYYLKAGSQTSTEIRVANADAESSGFVRF